MILCLGLAADRTFVHTLRALARSRARFAVVDLAHLALGGSLDARPGAAVLRLGLGGVEHALDACESVYARVLDIAARAPTPQLRERSAALSIALAEALAASATPVLNPPRAAAFAFSKLAHGPELARERGWAFPRSCLTSEPEEARAFLASCPAGAIFKGASAAKTWVTVYDAERHAERLRELPAGPALFQELIVGPDVRVHVVGERVFCERIESSAVDYRHGGRNAFAAIEPPAAIAEPGRALAAELSLPFLALDFKLERASGRWVFLELNTAPAYEGYDVRAGGAISAALADWLRSPPPAPSAA